MLEGMPKLNLKEQLGGSPANEGKVKVTWAEKTAQGKAKSPEHHWCRRQGGAHIHQYEGWLVVGTVHEASLMPPLDLGLHPESQRGF